MWNVHVGEFDYIKYSTCCKKCPVLCITHCTARILVFSAVHLTSFGHSFFLILWCCATASCMQKQNAYSTLWPSVLILFFVQAKLPHYFIPGPALLYFKGSTLSVWAALLFVGKWGKTTYLSTAHSTILHYGVTMVTWCMENKCRVLTRGRLSVEGVGQLNLLSFSD